MLPILCGKLKDTLTAQVLAQSLSEASPEHVWFRQMRLDAQALAALEKLTEESGLMRGDLLAAAYPFDGYFFQNRKKLSAEEYRTWKEYLLGANRSGYEALQGAYAAIWDDLDCAPVPDTEVQYENSWMFERTYGGTRGHEGCDLIPPADISDYYPVVSMTDGTGGLASAWWLAYRNPQSVRRLFLLCTFFCL